MTFLLDRLQGNVHVPLTEKTYIQKAIMGSVNVDGIRKLRETTCWQTEWIVINPLQWVCDRLLYIIQNYDITMNLF